MRLCTLKHACTHCHRLKYIHAGQKALNIFSVSLQDFIESRDDRQAKQNQSQSRGLGLIIITVDESTYPLRLQTEEWARAVCTEQC